ncbi:MAG: 3-oxoacyl-[acyl-carrier-protein] reductase [Candidatus Latescibacteria bacterium]|nr:3-oxoacyl-[acyl-carrier-protein] reductase [Candidatus Latescibacterota bacterium]
MARFTGKTAIVTGGAQGIGRTIAESFVAGGAAVALCDINLDGAQAAADEMAAGGAHVKAYRMNVADEESVAEAVAGITEEFERIDILVNNAGITRDNLMLRMKREDWDAVISINLTGAFTVSKAVVRGMMKFRNGRIVNIASVVGVMGNAGQANYSASKAGLIGLTKTMAKEFASRGVTVNAVAPGYVQTEMTDHLSDEAKVAFLKAVPLNRPGTPGDVSSAVTFLASDEASYITGQVLCVDGGMVM